MTTRRTTCGRQTAAEGMLSIPWAHSPATTVREIADSFGDDHVHTALIVGPAGYLVAVVEHADIAAGPAPDAPAGQFGRLDGRTVAAGSSLAEAHRAMIAAG